MLISLNNDSAIFEYLINIVLADFIRKIYMVCLNDVIIFGKTLEKKKNKYKECILTCIKENLL